MKKKIAITGGIGSGKSLVLSYIKQMGYPTFSCDLIYKEIINQTEYIHAVKELFPESVLENKIDRKSLAKIVFENPQKLVLLNRLSHPLILNRLENYMEESENELVFAEVPLLFENDLQTRFNKTIVVYRDLEKRIEAMCERDDATKEEACRKINAQFDYDKNLERLKKDAQIFVLYNNQDKEDLFIELEKIITNINES